MSDSSELNPVMIPDSIPAPPPPISMDDLLQSIEVISKQETEDKAQIESISNMSPDNLKSKLIAWAVSGFPTIYELHRVTVTPPLFCSDGVARSLPDYITFCSGKPISEHIATLQTMVSNMSISFAHMGTHISILVSKV